MATFVEAGCGTANRGALDVRDRLGALLRRRDAQHDGARGQGRRLGLSGQERRRIQGTKRFRYGFLLLKGMFPDNASAEWHAFRLSFVRQVTSLLRATATLPTPRTPVPSLCESV